MSIQRKVRSVERLFDRLEQEISNFKSQSTLQCVSGCGKCCTKPDIEASPLEFLPWAFHLFLNGKAEETLQQLEAHTESTCMLYRPFTVTDPSFGNCGEYKYRGLICRLFGYGASRDKFGQLRIVSCKLIKDSQQEEFIRTSEAILNGTYIPVFSDYYMNLSRIDFRLGNTILPINLAIKRAIEEVLHYYTYRPFPKKLKKIA